MLKPIRLDELPRYSPWPQRLLGLAACPVRPKTEKEVIREFEREKWGPLLKGLRLMRSPSVDKAMGLEVDLDAKEPFFESGRFALASNREIQRRYVRLLSAALRPYLKGAAGLVELGAGYGAQILSLSDEKGFKNLPLYAGEFTPSGQEAIRLVAAGLKKKIEVGWCDFRGLASEGLAIPENSVLFTSYSAHYVPEHSAGLVRFIKKWKPKAVVHFEPIYEHQSDATLHELLCRRYIEVNDYSRNLATVIETACRKKEARLLKVEKNVFGGNPLLPLSIMAWTPL